MYVQYPRRAERGIGSPGNEVMDGCELPLGSMRNQIPDLCKNSKGL